MFKKAKFWTNLEYILGLAVFVILFLLVFLNMSHELHDPDIWLHLKTGEYIIQHKAIPRTDIFSTVVSGKEWIDHSWLVQVIFYLVFRFTGVDNLIFFSTLIVTFAFLFLFFSVYRKRNQLTISVAILFIAILASGMRFNIRPENFSVLFFSIYILLLTRHIRSKGIFLLPLIQFLWVNCHGFFILGPLTLGVFILAEKLKRTGILPWEWSKVELLDRDSYTNLILIFWLVCLASLFNPYGFKGAFYPLWVTFSSIGKSNIFYKYIAELLPTWTFNYKLIGAYYVLIILSLLIFLINFRRINLNHFLMWLILLGISLRINRNIVYFNLMAFLTTTNMLIKDQGGKRFNWLEGFLGKSKYIFKYNIIIIIIALWALARGNDLLRGHYYIFEEDRYKSWLLGIATRCYPVKAADFILENNLPDNTFNLFNYGSYLIYRFSPKKKVFIDGRTELYGDDFFKNYQKILHIDEATVSNLFKKYNINTVLLSGWPTDIGDLAHYFFTQANDWVVVYFDKDSIIFLKKNPQNEMFIDKLKMDLKKWRVQKADLEKIGLKNVFPEPYIKRAWMFYCLGLYEQATQEAKEALRIQPSNQEAYNIIGKIYLQQKLYAEAWENLRLSYIYAPTNTETLINFGEFYMETAKFDKAVKVYKKLVKLNPRFAKGYYLLSQAYAKTNNPKLAAECLKIASRLDPFERKYQGGN